MSQMTEMIDPVTGEIIDEQQIAEQLLAQANEQGVSLVGPGGLLAGLTKTVLETALAVLTRIVVDVGEASGVELELSSSSTRSHGGFSCPTLMPGLLLPAG